MKAYLITTGSIFGLMTLIHLWRIVDEWRTPDRGFLISMAVITVITTALAAWAFRLLRLQMRP